jgi:hypothetical protein
VSTTPSHAWSLCHELDTIEHATAGAATVLAEARDTPGDGRAIRARVAEAEAMLSLVHRRLHDLGRVLRGELDPYLLAAPHNVVGPFAGHTNHGEDVVFAPKADVRTKRSARHARR